MWILLSAFLAATLLVLALRQHRHARLVQALRSAVERRQPLLRDTVPGAAGRGWDELCEAVNRQLQDMRQLEHQRSGQLTQLEVTLGSLQEAVLVVDTHNCIILANPALQEIFPNATQSVGERLEVVLHSVALINYVEAVREGAASPQQEMEFVDRDTTRWVEVTGTTIPPLDQSKGPWAIFVLHDITRQKQLENVRKEFVANVSHELRTPLSMIKGYVETLVDGHEQMPAEDRIRFLLTVQRHADRLHSLLDDLLTLSRLESSHPGLQLEPMHLPDLLTSMVEDYRGRPAATHHHLTCQVVPPLPEIRLDPLKFNQVLSNLLDNALKYTGPGSNISVSAATEGREVRVTVRDNGPGIPAADLPHIFQRFYRVEKGRSREKGGTGLGLSIVKHIVQLHGGRVWAESKLGQGTAFHLAFPIP